MRSIQAQPSPQTLGVLVGIRAPLRMSNPPETNVKNGIVVCNGRTSTFMLKYFPAQPIEAGDIVNVTGAGDTLVGSLLASSLTARSALFEDDYQLALAIYRAQEAACATLKCEEAVSPEIKRLA
jgi:pseudouridine-5'-phosphate glycosidase/pseudouridine kinase